jgi:hypothetical protein
MWWPACARGPSSAHTARRGRLEPAPTQRVDEDFVDGPAAARHLKVCAGGEGAADCGDAASSSAASTHRRSRSSRLSSESPAARAHSLSTRAMGRRYRPGLSTSRRRACPSRRRATCTWSPALQRSATRARARVRRCGGTCAADICCCDTENMGCSSGACAAGSGSSSCARAHVRPGGPEVGP